WRSITEAPAPHPEVASASSRLSSRPGIAAKTRAARRLRPSYCRGGHSTAALEFAHRAFASRTRSYYSSLELGPKWIRLRRTYCNCFWNLPRLPTHEQFQCMYQLDSAPQPALGHGRTLTYLMRARVLTCGRRNLLDNPL